MPSARHICKDDYTRHRKAECLIDCVVGSEIIGLILKYVGFWDQGLGFRVWGLGLGVYGFTVEGFIKSSVLSLHDRTTLPIPGSPNPDTKATNCSLILNPYQGAPGS